MPKRDIAHEQTDEALADLEKRISRIYADARDDMSAKVDEYFSYYRKREERQRELLKKGEITEEQFKQWRLNQMGRGQRFEAMRDKLADRMTRANEVAAAYINDSTPGVYSLNRNYAAYTIEQVAGDVDFTLWDEQTVKRLIKEQPDLMPYYPPERAVKRGIDLKWGKKQITAQVTSGILQGESIKSLADRLNNNIPDMNRTSAIRAARTAVTGAQNAGRIESYAAAQKMGIDLMQEWVATLDGRTRHSHAAMDGEKIEPGKKFSNGCRYPGDPSGPSWEVYNCRCSLVASLPDVDTSDAKRWARDPKTGEAKLIEDMTYSEWAKWQDAGAPLAEISDEVRKVHGKVDGQTYRVAKGSEVELFESHRERQKDGTWGGEIRTSLGSVEVPENADKTKVVVTKLPDKTGFLQFDETPNYILSGGRVALKSRAYNNSPGYQARAMIENEIAALGGLRKRGHYYRVINSDREIGYIKKGTMRPSVNHMTGEQEVGLSVWETRKYFGKLVEVTGELAGFGSDGEPCLDVSTLKFVRVVDDWEERFEEGKKKFCSKYGWTMEQLEKALRMDFEIK